MTDYTKTTDFTSKDSLPSGDSGKIIRGAEFGTEFDNIETAVNSKSNIENPSFTGNITVTGTVDGRDIAADGTKLDTIETSADVTDTANVTAAGAVMDSELTDITAVKALNQGVATTDSPTFAAVTSTGNVTVGGTVDGRDVAADGTKLDGIEAGATADQTAAQIKTAYESNADTNAFTDADHTKLDGIEASADVTDATNVTAAGALMDSELTDIAAVKALNQGVATTDSPTFAGATVNGTVEFDGLSGTGAVTVTDILDQDDMSGNSATALATQQSIKSYVDSQVATSDTLAEVLANGNATGGTDVAFGDNDKALFGDSSDLQISHDGTHSKIQETGTGDLKVQASNLLLEASDGTNYMYAVDGTAVRLYHPDATNGIKLATTSTGIDVTGTVSADGLTVDGIATLRDSVAPYIKFEETGVQDAYLGVDSGNLFIRQGALGVNSLTVGSNNDISFYEDTGTTAKFFWDASAESLGIGRSNNIRDKLTVSTTDTGTTFGPTTAAIDITNQDASGFGAYAGVNFRVGGGSYNESIAAVQAEYTAYSGNVMGELVFGTRKASTTDVTEAMRIDSSGNVGIGTDSPSAKLHIEGSTPVLRLRTTADTEDSLIHFADTSSNFAGVIAYSHNGNDMKFYTNQNERMRIDSAGQVGIGTSSPGAKLTSSGVTGTTLIQAVGADSNGFADLEIKSTGTAGACRLYFSDTAAQSGFIKYSHSDNSMPFGTAGTEAMRINSSQNVLVGTTDSSVYNNSSNTSADNGINLMSDGKIYAAKSGASVAILNRTSSDGNILEFNRSGTIVGSIGARSGDVYLETGDTGIRMYDQSDAIIPVGSAGISRDAAIDLGSGPNLRFKDLYLSGGVKNSSSIYMGRTDLNTSVWVGNSTVNAGDSSGVVRDAAVDLGYSSGRWKDLYLSNAVYAGDMGLSSGDLFVAIDGDANGITTGYKLRTGVASTSSASHLAFVNPNGVIGTIRTSGSATSFNTSSDYRLKENVVAMSGATERLKQLAPKRFNFIADADVTVDGFLAHEVQSVVPEAITGTHNEVDDDGNPIYQGIDQSKLVPLLVATIQELEARIAALESN